MSYLSPTLSSAFNKVFLGVKERFKCVILPLLYIKFPSSRVLLGKARKVFVGLTKGCTCCFLLNLYSANPALITHVASLPPIQYAQLALKWYFCGVRHSLCERWISFRPQCRGKSATAAASPAPGPALALPQALSRPCPTFSPLLPLAGRLPLQFPLLLCYPCGKC